MKHLNDDERLAFLEGRASSEVADHLNHCPECAAEINAWRRSIEKLENFGWPPSRLARRTISFPIFKLAAAAALAVCVGFAAARISAPNSAEIKAQLARELRIELRSDLLAVLNPGHAPAQDAFQQELKQKFEQAILRVKSAAPGAPEDRTAVLALLMEIREQQAANYLSLRRDLETLASTAEARLQTTSRRLMELATANYRSEENPIQ